MLSQVGVGTPSWFQPSLEAIHSAPIRIRSQPGSATASSDQ